MNASPGKYDNRIVDCPVYIVMDVPSPLAEKIQEFRREFDPQRAMLPVEITLTGSCGTGLVSKGQSLRDISGKLNEAAKLIHPFHVCFDKVDRFPNTDIYFLSLKDSPELMRTQKTVSESGIKFDANPYPYHPHCTLCLRKKIPDGQKLLDLFFLKIPSEPFRLDMISVYAMKDAVSCEILHKIELN